ncbi:hypothetical protein [Azospirillum sp.]|uniref:hypothetical protein n=1 Tax=Azospirillum sp. TaxID=34012 RepID=UPI002D5513C5|nr:hypothetical protein [Azospirillum sp.]HYD64014.1 hypothetical protein [Azospirillum sp.]
MTAEQPGDLVRQFHRLFSEQPGLLAGLHGLSVPAAAEALTRIGAVNGIPTSAAEIRRYAAQAVRRLECRHALGDDELDALTGGGAVTDAGGLLALFTPPVLPDR